MVVSTLAGRALVLRFIPFRSRCGLFGSFWLVGFLVGTWGLFAVSLVLGLTTASVLCTTLVVAGLCAFLARATRPLQNEKWAADDLPSIVGLVLVLPFFGAGVWRQAEGSVLFVGNFVDLPFHMAIASAFCEQDAIPPGFPQVAGARLVYHFLADFHSAALAKCGLGMLEANLLDELLLAIAMVLVVGAVFASFVGRGWACVAVALFLLAHNGSATLLFAQFGVPVGGRALSFVAGSFWASTREALLFPFYNFLHPILNFFMPQKPMLIGFGSYLIGLGLLRRAELDRDERERYLIATATLAAALPLFQVQMAMLLLATLVVQALLLAAPRRAVVWILCAVGAIALQLSWLARGAVTGRLVGADVASLLPIAEAPVLGSAVLERGVFWLRALGPFAILIGLATLAAMRGAAVAPRMGRRTIEACIIVGVVSFVAINFVRLFPNWGDSNKFLLPMMAATSVSTVAFVARRDESRSSLRRMVLWILIGLAVAPGVYDLLSLTRRLLAARVNGHSEAAEIMFTRCDQVCGQWVREVTRPSEVIAIADDVIHPVPAFSGRVAFLGGYENGLAPEGRREELVRIFEDASPGEIAAMGVQWVYLGHRESARFTTSRERLASRFGAPLRPPACPSECALFRVGGVSE